MRRLTALVIGNAAYPDPGQLRNPVHDATDVATKLKGSGFEVTTLADATVASMDKALRSFGQCAKDGDVAIFFFAGHGIQIEGRNFLIATDTNIEDEADAKYSSLPLDKVIDTLDKAASSTNIVILDACRNNPWERRWRGQLRGMAPVYAPKGTLIAYSTSPGEVASDGNGRNGAYTAALLQHLDFPDVPLETMFKRVRNTLSAATSGRQISWEHTSLSGDFFFNLSLASRLSDYGGTALKDRLFVLDEADPIHAVTKKLKTHDWYSQNPAIASLTVPLMSAAATDSLFVLGRNILQAADGTATGAELFISNLMNRTQGLPPQKQKALLDGILFEIFFDKDGERRFTPKTRNFQRAFDLISFPELKPSFDFLASCLAPEGERYFVLPGMPHAISIDVTLSNDGANLVEDIHIEGRSVLVPRDSEARKEDRNHIGYPRKKFEELVANQMLVPVRQAAFTYSQPWAPDENIGYEYGSSIARTPPSSSE